MCALVVGGYFEQTHGFAHFLWRTPSLAFGVRVRPGLDAWHGHVDIRWRVQHGRGPGRRRARRVSGTCGETREIGIADRLMQLRLRTEAVSTLAADKFFIDALYNGA